ncbi:MAG: hypothetical protein DMG11_16750, partial [Acidobacteria bacterium]
MPGFVLAVILVFVCMGECARAATTLYLPRQFQPSEMTTVGVAFMNPTLTDASVTFRLRTVLGAMVTTSQRTIPAKGQLPLALGEIFPGVSTAGWFSAEIDVEQVTGFWMSGDFVTSTDGARLLTASDAVAGPAFTFFRSTSEISLANLDSSAVTGNLLLVNASGTTVANVPFQVSAVGVFQRAVASLFPAQAASFDSNGYWIATNSSVPNAKLISTTMTPNGGSDNVVTNAASFATAQGLFPQIVGGQVGGTTYDTVLSLTNFRSMPNVTLTLKQNSGAVLTVQRTIPLNGVLRASVTSLFGVSSVDGWLQVEGAGLYATLTYTDTLSGGSTAVEMQSASAGDTGLIFGHIANMPPWWTGIALANSSTSNAQVEVYAFDSSGKLIAGPAESAAATFTLAAQTKRGFLLDEVLPQMQTRKTDGGYIYIRTTNGVQIHGIELFFLRSGRVYSNVPATRLGGIRIGFTPPLAASSGGSGGSDGGLTIEEAFLGDASNQPITSVQACGTITVNMRVNNTSGRTLSVTRQYRAIGPSGYVLYMGSFAGDQAAGRSLRYSTLTVPCDAPAGPYTLTGSVDYNGSINSTSGNLVVQSGGTPPPPPPPPPPPQGCVPSDTSICVLTNDYDSAPVLGWGACYDKNPPGRSAVQAVTLLAQGGSPLSGYTWTLANGSTFPPGTTVDANGVFKSSGGRLIPGTYSLTMQASDGSRTGTGRFTLVVTEESSAPVDGVPMPACPTVVFAQPNARTIALPAARQGAGYGASLYAILGSTTSTPLKWSVSSGQLPPGMTLDQDRGVVRGTPFSSAAGSTYRFRVNITSLNP